METTKIWRQFTLLPPQAQQEAADFIAFLQKRYPRSYRRPRPQKQKLTGDPFIGLWKDREDLQDSVSWVRETRRKEWKN